VAGSGQYLPKHLAVGLCDFPFCVLESSLTASSQLLPDGSAPKLVVPGSVAGTRMQTFALHAYV
jgi:hypothetical protein